MLAIRIHINIRVNIKNYSRKIKEKVKIENAIESIIFDCQQGKCLKMSILNEKRMRPLGRHLASPVDEIKENTDSQTSRANDK